MVFDFLFKKKKEEEQKKESGKAVAEVKKEEPKDRQGRLRVSLSHESYISQIF